MAKVYTAFLPYKSNNEPMTQMSESALGYSVSGTYLVPGGGLFIKNRTNHENQEFPLWLMEIQEHFLSTFLFHRT